MISIQLTISQKSRKSGNNDCNNVPMDPGKLADFCEVFENFEISGTSWRLAHAALLNLVCRSTAVLILVYMLFAAGTYLDTIDSVLQCTLECTRRTAVPTAIVCCTCRKLKILHLLN